MKGIDRLLDLQAADSAIDRLQARRRELESGEELQAARAAMEEAESRLGELRLALDAVDAEQERLEHEIDGLERKTAAEERRMYDGSIVNVKELQALQAEITALKARKSRTEDELLEQMERREDFGSRLAGVEGLTAEARARYEEAGGAAIRELDEVAVALAQRTAERAAIVAEVDEEILELYEDLRRQKHGIGAAALIDGVCQGCHEKLSALELDRLKKLDGVRRCEHCRRILIFA